ncbi:MAG TPA: hypothetical protein VGV61_05300 [Thermoanaerobaculia bacterium]|jgi:hypothetical protein|nr:hypothetical protein [Thermoanaerobaculia bacterium]
MSPTRNRWPAAVALGLFTAVAAGAAVDGPQLRALVAAQDHAAIKALGPAVLPQLADLYSHTTDVAGRRDIAQVLYVLGEKSPAAEKALLADLHSPDKSLRIQVQYTLGRVSDDERVVQLLLDSMRHGETMLIRDKAACALAYDQIHLGERQKVKLFAGLIQALDDDKRDVRAIARQALQIHTGQDKGYDPDAPPEQRRAAITEWQRWLLEYRANL